jgi:predicted aspartyl protease
MKRDASEMKPVMVCAVEANRRTSRFILFRSFLCCLLPFLVFTSSLNAAPGDIPARIAGRVIFVPVRLNDHGPYSFVLDTGATDTVLTPATASAAGARTKLAIGSQKKGSVDRLLVGPVGVTNLPVFVFDPPQALSLRLDEGIDYGGILGYTFLSRFATTIDYARRVVRLDPPVARKRPESPGACIVPFRLVDRLIHVSVTLNQRRKATLLLDTGSAETLLTPALAESMNLPTTPFPSYPGARLATLDQVAMGDATVSRISAIVHAIPGERGPTSYDGILGYPFLSQFVVTIRYDNQTIRLVPIQREPTAVHTPITNTSERTGAWGVPFRAKAPPP